jgi:flavin-dependent dehydrogenase
MPHHDIVIFGGGPAGSATALALRRHAPELSVLLVEASNFDTPRAGEVLPALGGELLTHLGVREAFERQAFRPVAATAAAWNTPWPEENHSLYSARGHGWHLSRARFDRLLAEAAQAQGASLLLGRAPHGIATDSTSWRITLDNNATIQTRFIVDATGRRRAILRRLGESGIVHDRLAGYVYFFPDLPYADPRTLIEARPEGWWYTAPLTNGVRVIACMTDVDLGRQLRLPEHTAWRRMLEQTEWVEPTASTTPSGRLIRAAGSSRATRVHGEGWVAVGDAAATFDPLSAQGIVKALRSGVFAAYAIADHLQGRNANSLERYAQCCAQEFANYQHAYADYYGRERRWLDELFWRRRSRPLSL